MSRTKEKESPPAYKRGGEKEPAAYVYKNSCQKEGEIRQFSILSKNEA